MLCAKSNRVLWRSEPDSLRLFLGMRHCVLRRALLAHFIYLSFVYGRDLHDACRKLEEPNSNQADAVDCRQEVRSRALPPLLIASGACITDRFTSRCGLYSFPNAITAAEISENRNSCIMGYDSAVRFGCGEALTFLLLSCFRSVSIPDARVCCGGVQSTREFYTGGLLED